jgi:hypothetical protein
VAADNQATMDYAPFPFSHRFRFLPALLLLMTAAAGLSAPANFESGSLTRPVQSDGRQWNVVTFTRTFATPPVVIMGPATANEVDPCVIRVRNVTTTGFQYQIDEWDSTGNGRHNTPETVHFFALTADRHVFGTQRWQVGRLTSVNRAPAVVTLNGFGAL